MPSRYLNDPRMLLKARSVLLAAYDLLSDRSQWTQGTVARDWMGRSVSVTDPSAERWCAVGAIERAASEMELPVVRRSTIQSMANELMMRDLKRMEGTDSIPEVNDRNGPEVAYEKIMASFNRLLSPSMVAIVTRRREAAMRGWVTRRMMRQPKETPPPTEPVMTFGGTLPTTDASTASAERKDSPSVSRF